MLAKIMLVDDNPRVLESLVALFEDDYQLLSASSGPESIAHAQSHEDIAVVVMDIKMEGMDGIVAAQRIREILPKVMVIFHTGFPGDYDEQRIDRSEKPFDYIDKGQSAVKLVRSVRNAVEAYQFACTGRLDSTVDGTPIGIVGRSQAILKIVREVEKIAESDIKVMIFGDTGTGKDVVAKAIHLLSPRRNKPFSILHCNHKSPDLVASELFGHSKGSFTDSEERKGMFGSANGGTIFLDEIGDLDITTQAKLLRVLDTGIYTRLGEDEPRKTDVRVICATHKDLAKMTKEGTFRSDLFFRLKGVSLVLPKLGLRREDIPLLVKHFAQLYIQKYDGLPMVFTQQAIERLVAHEWQGNVRELREAVESILARSYSGLVDANEIDEYLNGSSDRSESGGDPSSLSGKVESYKCALIVNALREANGNYSLAAELLKTDKANLRKYCIDHNLQWE